MAEILIIVKTNIQAIVRLFNAWDSASSENKICTLSIASGRGSKVKLEQVKDKLPEMVENTIGT